MIHKNKSDTAKQLLALFSRGGDTNSRTVRGKFIFIQGEAKNAHQKQENQSLF